MLLSSREVCPWFFKRFKVIIGDLNSIMNLFGIVKSQELSNRT